MAKMVPVELIAQKIFLIRGHKVMLDKDLAKLYGVSTGRLNEQVRRNIKRFPEDFMFRLTEEEANSLISQIAISNRGGSRHLPYAFTEQGVAMLSSVLHSDRAITVNIQIMRTFVKLKELLLTNVEFSRRLEALERKFGEHDEKIALIFEAIKKLLEPPPEKPKRQIGFGAGN